MNNCLTNIYQWAKNNNLAFNSSKFEHIQYGLDNELKSLSVYHSSSGEPIEKCSSISDLGISMCNDATFKHHIDNICITARKMISWICRTFRSRSVTTMLTTWKALVLPKLEYCSQLWSPHLKKDVQRLELVQRDFVRKINIGSKLNYWETLNHLNMYSLERRRERYIIMYVWKIIEGLVPNVSASVNRQITVHQSLRFGRKCVIPPFLTNSRFSVHYENSLAVIGPKLFNVMPRDIRDLTNCSINAFKCNLDTFLLTVTDQPVIPGYNGGNNQLHGSNSLIDVVS